jgi:predicted transcriptional regulator
MTRRPVTVELDANLVEAAHLIAERAGVAEFELYERALRDVLVRDYGELMDEIRKYQSAKGRTLTDDEAMEIAISELEAMRTERRNAS